MQYICLIEEPTCFYSEDYVIQLYRQYPAVWNQNLISYKVITLFFKHLLMHIEPIPQKPVTFLVRLSLIFTPSCPAFSLQKKNAIFFQFLRKEIQEIVSVIKIKGLKAGL